MMIIHTTSLWQPWNPGDGNYDLFHVLAPPTHGKAGLAKWKSWPGGFHISSWQPWNPGDKDH